MSGTGPKQEAPLAHPKTGIHGFRYKKPVILLMISSLFIFVSMVAFISIGLFRPKNCLPAPYLYVTYRGGENILLLSRDGCLLETDVVWYGSHHPRELRQMSPGQYKGQEVLFVANSPDIMDGDLSQIIVLGSCSARSHTRSYIASADTAKYGSVHPYSIVPDRFGNLYASFQHTDGVVRFAKDTLLPMPFPSTINHLHKNGNRYVNAFGKRYVSDLPNGTFAQFGLPGIHNTTEQGIRSLVWVPRNYSEWLLWSASPDKAWTKEPEQQLWVANEDYNRIFILDSEAREVGWIKVNCPIGMFYDKSRGIVFVGSKSTKVSGGGAVYGIDVNSWSVVKTFKVIGKIGIMHPSGLVVYQDTLFVAEQIANVVVTFNITSERYMNTVMGYFPGPVEHIILSYC